jgi:hypothetical protein
VKNLDISKKCKEEHSKSGELTELEASWNYEADN